MVPADGKVRRAKKIVSLVVGSLGQISLMVKKTGPLRSETLKGIQ
jgi:hypothetical protein